MGWYYVSKGKETSIRQFFAREFDEPSTDRQVIDCAVVKLKTAYLAYRIGDQVTAIVCLLDYRQSEFNFGYKSIDEDDGPCETDCPARIFRQLTPLPETGHNWAKQWRAEVQTRLERLAKRVPLTDGCTVTFEQPISFGAYGTHDTFTVRVRRGHVGFYHLDWHNTRYHIRNWADRPYHVQTDRS